ncbi:acyl transferase [Apibacter muscae]|uniref:Acyl transferase n=1 Tax=Apibacter muscae TaxID=2509004 RepID=A0A563D7P1_9FLAO|nr:acyl transferase [Apibacter muscae]TWP26033.1 acyl transferase [Apibacter muscae]TWP27883.1 acyl transferase [Apibacter muscae]
MIKDLNIFDIKSEDEFNHLSLKVFNYQYLSVPIYKKFVDLLSINPNEISNYKDIPFLPIEFFKTHSVLDKNYNYKFYFQSSGTTSTHLSKHFIVNEQIYEQSILKSFTTFFGNPAEYIFLGLLPSYLERENSSLIYMVNYLMKLSNHKENNFYLHNFSELDQIIKKTEQENKKVILFGVSYALLDFVEAFPQKLEHTMVIETGGMKGRKEEITKEELLNELKNSFQTHKIYSEYSMTELLSQAYSLGQNIYECPSWMRILIRDIEDPFCYKNHEKTGAINIIDLANIHSCSFISTQDLGKTYSNNSFEVLGRIDNSDIRGCSLLVI